MDEKEFIFKVIGWAVGAGLTFIITVITFIWGYMKFFLKTKWREDDTVLKNKIDDKFESLEESIRKDFEKQDESRKEDFNALKKDLLKEVTTMINGYSKRTDGDVKNIKEQLNKNETRDESREKENKADVEKLHERINNTNKSFEGALSNIKDNIEGGRKEQTTILTKILVEVAKLQVKNE